MSKYMIHACKNRLWYVRQYLVPSLIEQGVKNDDIAVYVDDKNEGCLTSYINSFKQLTGEGTWHLQDDVVISKQFRKLTEQYDDGVVCGYCNCYDKHITWGYVSTEKMWYSFPCIRIPDNMAIDFAKWLRTDKVQQTFGCYIKYNKHIDVLFQSYINETYSTMTVLNLSPNIINHIDYLIGGSVINGNRNEGPEELMAVYWEDSRDTIDRLERSLRNGTRN